MRSTTIVTVLMLLTTALIAGGCAKDVGASAPSPTNSPRPPAHESASPVPNPQTTTASAAAVPITPTPAQVGRTSAPTTSPARTRDASPKPPRQIRTWVYQLQGYDDDGLDELARTHAQLAVIDLARDASTDYFRADEIRHLRATGKKVLAYFEIGSIENFRPEYRPLRDQAPDLILNQWPDWPDEYFVRYWDRRWWDRVVRPRIDQAMKAGFDGVYLDTPLAYEELDLARVPGRTREDLAAAMVELIRHISSYAKQRRPGFWIVPQNSPELRRFDGYVQAIDGIGMEELFFRATDQPCVEDYCTENLDNTRALRDDGKLVLAVDYATEPDNVRSACRRYAREGFAGYVTGRDLDRIGSPCF